MAKKKTTQEGNAFAETVVVVIQALLLAIVVRTFLFQPFTIPSGSMKPTLLIGDYLFVSKYSYGYSKYSFPFSPKIFSGRIWSGEPERGQVAVFRYTQNTTIDYIKRVIGLPGDKVQMKNGVLYLNGQEIEKKPIGTYSEVGSNLEVPMFEETLPNGVKYTVLDLNVNDRGDNTDVFEVPEGHYFMMGDNRDNSLDSRFELGFVPLENFIGPARMIFFSVDGDASPLEFWRWPSHMRTDRLFKGL